MNFFQKLFTTAETATHDIVYADAPFKSPTAKTEQELIEIFGGMGLEKQPDVPVVTGNNSWHFSMETGSITFGHLAFPVQILGTISHSSNTWMWAWANDKSGIPTHLKRQAFKLKDYGATNQIELLSHAQFDATIETVHFIGCVASGMFNSSCYYIADYGQGAMLVTIKDRAFDNVQKTEHHRILTTFPQLISNFDMNHRAALINYLGAKGYSVSETHNTVVGKKKTQTVSAQFDVLNRCININGDV
jgi:hypothetical protein